MNADSLKYKVKVQSLQTGVSPQDLLKMYFFERLLYRISISKYKTNFILKGGFFLTILLGENKRTTQDIDMLVKNVSVNRNSIISIIQEILKVKSDDDIMFQLLKVKDIRLMDKYGGLKVYLMGVKENIRIPLSIDITTGDPIIPKELSFSYCSIFDNTVIKIMTFSVETVIAEKFETLLSTTTGNTRLKDFYDLYMLISKYENKIDNYNLILALTKTCERRKSCSLLIDVRKLFNIVKNSEQLQSSWNRFQKRYIYAKDIDYLEIMSKIEIIVKILEEDKKVTI